jgi:hypothetical protein
MKFFHPNLNQAEMAAYTSLLFLVAKGKHVTSRCPIGQYKYTGTSAVHVNVIGWALEGPYAQKKKEIG